MPDKKPSPSVSRRSSQLRVISNPIQRLSSTISERSSRLPITKITADLRTSTTSASLKTDVVHPHDEVQTSTVYVRSLLSVFGKNPSKIQSSTAHKTFSKSSQESTTPEKLSLNSAKSNLFEKSHDSVNAFTSNDAMTITKALILPSEQRPRITYISKIPNNQITQASQHSHHQIKTESKLHGSESVINLISFDSSKVFEKSPVDAEKPIISNAANNPYIMQASQMNNQALQTNQGPNSSDPMKPDNTRALTTYQNPNQPNGTSKSNDDESDDEIMDMLLDKKTLRMGVFIICMVHLMSIIVAVVVYFLVFLSNMTYKINLLLRVGIIIGIVVKGLHLAALFVGAYKENPVALHCANMLGWSVFLTQEILGVMGFTFFVRIAHLTWNFLIALYFVCIVLSESISFCRNSLIVTAYRELLLSRPLDGNILLLALCCSNCNLTGYIQASRRPDPT